MSTVSASVIVSMAVSVAVSVSEHACACRCESLRSCVIVSSLRCSSGWREGCREGQHSVSTAFHSSVSYHSMYSPAERND